MNLRIHLLSVLSASVLFFSGCGGYVPAEELEKDIAGLDSQIGILSQDMAKHSSGVLLELMQIRMEILKNTRAMLEQKRSGSNRLIHINYTVKGTPYIPPADKSAQLEKIERAIMAAQERAAAARLEAERYEGGLIKIMVEMKAVTEENTAALLNQKRMSLVYDFPLYAIAGQSILENTAAVRKPLEGSTIENL